MAIIFIDARRIVDPASMHDVLMEAFGFPPSYGRNLDALVDCLSMLDNPKAGMSRVQVFPGEQVLLAIEHIRNLKKPQEELIQSLADAIAYVNWRRLERNQPAVLSMAYDRSS